MEPYCLSKLNAHHAEDFGGKGNGLKKLMTLGLNVPLTYGFSVEAWRGFNQSVETVLKTVTPPSELSFPLIIRSSATVEDQNEFSCAGIFHSQIVSGPAEWMNALKSVMSSILDVNLHPLFAEFGIDPNAIAPCFIVQSHLKTRRRGVGFSRSPQKLWDETAVIEIGSELTSVVEGSGPSQTFTAKENSDSALKPLFDHLLQLEKSLKTPVDLEWGELESGELIFFQCRPIAGPEASTLRAVLNHPRTRWTRKLAQERFPECLTPMGWDVIRDGIPTNLRSCYEYYGLKTGGPENLAFSDEGWIYHADQFF